MRNIKLLIEYDGTNYGGWQRQKNAITIQETIEKGIQKITNEDIQITGCSRTDAGVHAKGFIANFYTNSRISEEKFKTAINSQLPSDIIILDSKEVDIDFHARYNSKGKTYSYTILNANNAAAIGRNYIYHFRWPLNLEAMKKGAAVLVGKHDFGAFRTTGSSVKTSVRTVTQLDVEKNNDLIKIYATADGFLYNMVRIIVGTLLEVGCGKITPERVSEILECKDRSKAGVSVPPQGLCLEKVYY
jgi:tRNA pseudouridine38-40 synthase